MDWCPGHGHVGVAQMRRARGSRLPVDREEGSIQHGRRRGHLEDLDAVGRMRPPAGRHGTAGGSTEAQAQGPIPSWAIGAHGVTGMMAGRSGPFLGVLTPRTGPAVRSVIVAVTTGPRDPGCRRWVSRVAGQRRRAMRAVTEPGDGQGRSRGSCPWLTWPRHRASLTPSTPRDPHGGVRGQGERSGADGSCSPASTLDEPSRGPSGTHRPGTPRTEGPADPTARAPSRPREVVVPSARAPSSSDARTGVRPALPLSTIRRAILALRENPNAGRPCAGPGITDYNQTDKRRWNFVPPAEPLQRLLAENRTFILSGIPYGSPCGIETLKSEVHMAEQFSDSTPKFLADRKNSAPRHGPK